jgi:Skp family chaperone for outer membrane proteins
MPCLRPPRTRRWPAWQRAASAELAEEAQVVLVQHPLVLDLVEQLRQPVATEAEREALRERFELEDELSTIQEQRAAAESQGANRTASANTALGAFTFDAYPAEVQRRVQERTADATEKVAASISTIGFQ